MQKVYLVITEINGYRNFYGDYVFTDKQSADAAADAARLTGRWADVRVIWLWLE